MPASEATPLVNWSVRQGEDWRREIYVFGLHEIISITPGSGLSTILFKDAHAVSNGAKVRIAISESNVGNDALSNLWTATVGSNPNSLTIPIVAPQASGTGSGFGGPPEDLSLQTGTMSWFDEENNLIASPVVTIPVGTDGAIVFTMAASVTKNLQPRNLSGDCLLLPADEYPFEVSVTVEKSWTKA